MEKIDLKDRKILYHLDLDSRQSFRSIGRKVGLSKDVVASRVKRLKEKKIIEYFLVRTDPSLMGYNHIKIYIRLHNITKEKEEELLSYLEQKNVYWLSSLRGKYDLVASIYVRNIGEFSRKYEELFDKWREYILDRNIVVHEKAYIYTKSYLLPEQKSGESIYGRWLEKPVHLDNIDIALLKILNKNGRAPIINIAKELNISSDKIRNRITNLKKKGVITGFGTKIDFRKLNNNYHIIFLNLQNMNLKKQKKLEKLAKINRNVIYFIQSIGDHNFELEVETTCEEELDALIKSLRDHFVNEIKDYEILEVTREHRLTYFPF